MPRRDCVEELALCAVLRAKDLLIQWLSAAQSPEQPLPTASWYRENKERGGKGTQPGYKIRCINKRFLVFCIIPSFASIRHHKGITPSEISTNKCHIKLH